MHLIQKVIAVARENGFCVQCTHRAMPLGVGWRLQTRYIKLKEEFGYERSTKQRYFDPSYLFHLQALEAEHAGAVETAEELVQDTIVQHFPIKHESILRHAKIIK
jgi:hypothetical protein